MLSSTEKLVIISGSILGSIFLLSNSLNLLNDIMLRNNHLNKYDENNANKVIIINGLTILFSAGSFGYFTYIAIK